MCPPHSFLPLLTWAILQALAGLLLLTAALAAPASILGSWIVALTEAELDALSAALGAGGPRPPGAPAPIQVTQGVHVTLQVPGYTGAAAEEWKGGVPGAVWHWSGARRLLQAQ